MVAHYKMISLADPNTRGYHRCQDIIKLFIFVTHLFIVIIILLLK